MRRGIRSAAAALLTGGGAQPQIRGSSCACTWNGGPGSVGVLSDRARFGRSSSGCCSRPSLCRAVWPPSRPISSRRTRFDEGAGTSAGDLSGNGNVGALQGASWTTAGKFGGALSFDGASSRLRVPDAASLDVTSALTVEAWVFPAATQGGWRAVVQKEPDSYLLQASSDAGNLRPVGRGASDGRRPARCTGPTALPVGVVVTSGGCVRPDDHPPLRQRSAGGEPRSNGRHRPIDRAHCGSAEAAYGEYFNGRVDEVRVYRVALSQAEIQADMAAPLGGPPDTSLPSQVSGLAASAVSSSRIDLSWSAASDNVGGDGVRDRALSGCGVFGLCGGDDGVDVGVERYGPLAGDVVQLSGAGAGCGGESGAVFVGGVGGDAGGGGQSAVGADGVVGGGVGVEPGESVVDGGDGRLWCFVVRGGAVSGGWLFELRGGDDGDRRWRGAIRAARRRRRTATGCGRGIRRVRWARTREQRRR